MPAETVFDTNAEIEGALDRLRTFEKQLPDGLKPLLRLAPPKGMRAQVALEKESGAVHISYDPAAVTKRPLTADFDFEPVTIRGELLSTTVLRERR